ncbi:hypothetical protein G3567_02605 [Psychroflexus sp. YR1-1]|uniref:Uncharacterized protein n=1 Tax=Psychroflexus aurantiacus TaxID=2709310 RepID=A0A6B3R1V2_9FLAO|nr:hypothetical protein [Psychroflexus aurantiacus]NEV93037.1 hypothetical protein [Psychroflexus aurantiacus]
MEKTTIVISKKFLKNFLLSIIFSLVAVFIALHFGDFSQVRNSNFYRYYFDLINFSGVFQGKMPYYYDEELLHYIKLFGDPEILLNVLGLSLIVLTIRYIPKFLKIKIE